MPAYYPDKDSPPVLGIDPARRDEWLDAVYSDTTLITKLMPVPLSRPLRPAVGYTPTLAVTDGHTGYPVRQYSPQHLWDQVEQAATFWNEQGQPSYEQSNVSDWPVVTYQARWNRPDAKPESQRIATDLI